MKRLLTLLTASALLAFGATTTQASEKASHTPTPAKTEIFFGATVGDFSDLVSEGLKPILEEQGYKVRLVQFTDYVQPNIALAEKRLDVNIFQHKPYLEQFIAQKGLKLSAVAQVPTAPLGLYAGKRKSLQEATKGIRVAVPNDPTNLSRSLRILANLGWIELKEETDLFRASPNDIARNPLELRIIQLEAAQLPRAAQDVDYAVINGNYVVSAGLSLSDALAREQGNDYVNWAVVRSEDVDAPHIAAVVAALESDAFKHYALQKFRGYNQPEQWAATATHRLQ